MYSIKRGALLAITLLTIANPCYAAENAFKTIFQDVFYGALSGALVGAAVLAFTEHPGRHLDYIGYGAAAGVLVGATYGAVTTTRSLAELENGEVKFSMPTIIPEIREIDSRGHTTIVATAELIRGRF
ncbi:MAG: hypothetical protein A2075_18805 [Geobacteraceae bacterium GWC2_58_44]|nr:MAG: hypothetical protein A2075_18805 [Geobacteraceae bacterium GWC2_58_44]